MHTNGLTTAEILAVRKLGESVDTRCVEWAIGMLEKGSDSPSLRVLAGEIAPFNQFEMGNLLDQVLEELGLTQYRTEEEAARVLTSVCAQHLLDGSVSIDAALSYLSQLCIELDYLLDIYDFYLLHFAREDLLSHGTQHYWPDANPENIDQIVSERCRTWLTANPVTA